MTTTGKIEALMFSAGAAGDDEQVALCRTALSGDARAIAVCLEVCRSHEIDSLDVREWVANAERGDYLATYWEGEDDPGSRCGWSDSALDDVKRRLGRRDLTLRADDRGLVVVEVQS